MGRINVNTYSPLLLTNYEIGVEIDILPIS